MMYSQYQYLFCTYHVPGTELSLEDKAIEEMGVILSLIELGLSS